MMHVVGCHTMDIAKGCVFLLLGVSLSLGCVSHTERLPYRPHLTQQDEGVWAEVKREFGWQSTRKTKKAKKEQESLYSKMTRSVKGWFGDDEQPIGLNVRPHHWKPINEVYDREQQKLGVY